MGCEPVDEVIVVLEGVNALLHQQCEVSHCLVVAAIPVWQEWSERLLRLSSRGEALCNPLPTTMRPLPRLSSLTKAPLL